MRPHQLILAALAVSTAAGCANDTSSTTPDTTVETKQPPPRPAGAAAGDGAGATFAVTRYFVGDRTLEGELSDDAWEQYGYDRDRLITVDEYERHCRPNGGAAPMNVFPDGDAGTDNAFGKVLLPWLPYVTQPTVPDVGDAVHAELGRATSGLVLHLRDLGAGASYDPIDAFAYRAHVNADGTWSLDAESVDDPTAGNVDALLLSGRVHFPRSYVTGETWVGLEDEGEDLVLDLTWDVASFTVPLRLHHPIITMQLSSTRAAGTAGIISGILRTEELIERVRVSLGGVTPAWCEGAEVEQILNSVRQASDIMASGKQDPQATCDGISVGFGFEATAATVAGVAEPAVPPPAPCTGSAP